MVVAMGATSCRKDDKGIAGDRMTIGANIVQHGGDGSKTAIGPEAGDQFPVLWSDGDEFTLYSGENLCGTTFGITSGVGSESAVFEGANPGDAAYFASYPAAEVTRTNATTFIYEIPRIQSDLNHAGPMVGYSADGQSVNFENAASWVRIGLKGNAKVTKVELGSKVSKSHPSSALFGQLRITVGNDGKIVETTVMDNKADHSMLEKAYRTPVELNPDESTYFDFLVPEGAFGDLNKAHVQKAQFKVFGTDGAELATFEKEMSPIERNMVYVGEYGEAINEPAAHETVNFGTPDLNWSVCNLGATNGATKESWYGDYYAWGETAPYYQNGVWCEHPSHNSGITFDASVGYKWKNYLDGSSTSWDASKDWKPYGEGTTLTSEHDAATQAWGGGWRMPTTEEWQALYDNNTFEWLDVDAESANVSGFKAVAAGYLVVKGGKESVELDPSVYMFLPAAGYRDGVSLNGAGSYGRHWSSSLYSSDPYYAYIMNFYSGDVYPQIYNERFNGFTVRPVR